MIRDGRPADVGGDDSPPSEQSGLSRRDVLKSGAVGALARTTLRMVVVSPE
jgi:hypothetical protein